MQSARKEQNKKKGGSLEIICIFKKNVVTLRSQALQSPFQYGFCVRSRRCPVRKKKMTTQYKNIHLAIMAIEGGAQKMHISGCDMYSRLQKQGLIHNYLIPYYEELHTQSREWLVDTTVEALQNWETAK